MVDVFAVADVIVNRIKTHYPQDVAIVGYYGSYLQGRATERSDLDFFFIPATPRGSELELQFIIDEISFDFWPIGWDRANGMARFQEWNTTIIADCELLYVRSEEDRVRFMELRKTITSMSEPSNLMTLINKSEDVLRDCFSNLTNYRLAGNSMDLSYCRMVAYDITSDIFRCLALLNQTFYKRSWGHYRDQVNNLPLKPEQLNQYLDTIMFSKSVAEITHACEQLTIDTLHLISSKKPSQDGMRSYKDQLKGYYEEERGMFNKLLTACEKGRYETAFFVAIGVQDGLARRLYAAEKGQWPGLFDLGDYREFYYRYGYPDLSALLDPTDLEPLRLAVLKIIEMLEDQLRSEDVPMNKFSSVAEFEIFINNRV